MIGALSTSIAFMMGNETAMSTLFVSTLTSGLVIPAYRAEYIFGFVLGMTFVFGAVLPTKNLRASSELSCPL
ncbi:hypothetical protein VB151_11390 [Xanthomonas fragariae]|nr:hypothetical protein [Xanthomonas fragariae]AOD15680.1 hypothetical protein BER92_14415 [Xanthomonas fragariae]AOD19092.1 hypothetical protein BER93_14450 [Xanthomonas fragariae]MBL9196771.1 hypothetical protein [Xanthomonas fragariae]MDM7572831.1 hypothetical protein [Xanthomonas fragariae]MDM7589191.1 hypothetical protein [Xanthomonas fragariae]